MNHCSTMEPDLFEILQENWEQRRKAYNEKETGEQEEILDYFDGALEKLGEVLFGEDSELNDLE